MMTDSDKEKFKQLGFNEHQLHVADLMLNGIGSTVRSSDPKWRRRFRKELRKDK